MSYHYWSEKRSLWKSRLAALQLQFRDCFRVAVDKQRPGHGHHFDNSSRALRRLTFRFQNLFSNSSSSPLILNRRGPEKDIAAMEDSAVTHMLRAVAVPVLGNMCYVFMHGLNCIQIYGAEKLHKALTQRSIDQSLITVSNHVAAVDDPFVIASLLPPSVLLDARSLRWTLCATDRCFRNPMTSAFFRAVKVLPLTRGEGVYQMGMDMALSKLNRGEWVHIFPEGSRSRDGGKTMGSSKRGIGRLVMDANKMPLVVPFVHTGMQEIMPVGTSIPKVGKQVTVLVGDPIEFDDLLLSLGRYPNISRRALYDAVSSRIGNRLEELKTHVEKLDLELRILGEAWQPEKDRRVSEIMEQVDWEAFGFGNFILGAQDTSPVQPTHLHSVEARNYSWGLKTNPIAKNRYATMGFSYEGGITSRLCRFMDPTELVGFAAKGLMMSSRKKEKYLSSDVTPLRAWRLFLEEKFQDLGYI
ncbi:tafazzin isoform X1 [Amborella trichopoda]|uniref:Tafazzin family protein n=1 Tax=Amborella trichopoda TaxID=13333 RepID=W1P3L3_AMBTC|nr:tafazzin isoform X1 [Amborella trichopoda]XP_020520460.1 tafazzin isoform X1 [Amborella trichopoda]XP_020520462.1 tafazzin isoform X1 [Amborella trichopoda]XP_020520463.1 tafazzin isoform X1 [Amborella trichopoda]ERN02214.1 hypothetical protein AMTR_s00045p00212070 [Amborella trichopoda]|eukprot:XP_020520459.1 tafazzin isoform X1 [Amborella trichopoda]